MRDSSATAKPGGPQPLALFQPINHDCRVKPIAFGSNSANFCKERGFVTNHSRRHNGPLIKLRRNIDHIPNHYTPATTRWKGSQDYNLLCNIIHLVAEF